MRNALPMTISAVAALGISLAAPTPQARPRAITEQFLPVLPCHPGTTVGQEGCGEHEVLTDDKRLMADVTVIFHLLTGASAKQDFLRAQTTWLAYRNADCASQSDAYQGGTEQPVLYVYCLANDDVSRRLDLRGFYAVLSQGLSSQAPVFP